MGEKKVIGSEKFSFKGKFEPKHALMFVKDFIEKKGYSLDNVHDDIQVTQDTKTHIQTLVYVKPTAKTDKTTLSIKVGTSGVPCEVKTHGQYATGVNGTLTISIASVHSSDRKLWYGTHGMRDGKVDPDPWNYFVDRMKRAFIKKNEYDDMGGDSPKVMAELVRALSGEFTNE